MLPLSRGRRPLPRAPSQSQQQRRQRLELRDTMIKFSDRFSHSKHCRTVCVSTDMRVPLFFASLRPERPLQALAKRAMNGNLFSAKNAQLISHEDVIGDIVF